MRPWRLAVVVGVVLACLAASAARAEDSWVGKRVMTKEGRPKIGHTDENGRDVEDGEIVDAIVTVLKEKGQWVKVASGGASGWIAKDELVPVDEAIAYFTRKVRANADDDRAWAMRAVAWKDRGDLDNAVKDESEALRLNPDDPGWWNNRGYTWYLKKEYDKAVADCNEAIRLDPSDPMPYDSRGLCRRALKQYDKALADFTEAIRLAPKVTGYYNDRGNTHYDRQDYDKAIRDYEEAMRLDPQAPLYRTNRGWAWDYKKDYEKALADFEEAVRIAPDNAEGYNGRAWVWATCPDEKRRDGQKAVESAKKACELADNKTAVYFDTLAAAYAELGRFDDAVAQEKKGLEVKDISDADKKDMEEHLKLFEDHKPLRFPK